MEQSNFTILDHLFLLCFCCFLWLEKMLWYFASVDDITIMVGIDDVIPATIISVSFTLQFIHTIA